MRVHGFATPSQHLCDTTSVLPSYYLRTVSRRVSSVDRGDTVVEQWTSTEKGKPCAGSMHEVRACNDVKMADALGYLDCQWGEWEQSAPPLWNFAAGVVQHSA